MKEQPPKTSSRQRAIELLSSLSASAAKPVEDVQCVDYDWLSPNCFSAKQTEELSVFCRTFSSCLQDGFKKYYRSGCKMEFDSMKLSFSGQTSQNDGLCLGFVSQSGGIYGLVDIPKPTASVWVKKLLGDSQSEDEKEISLSSLETSLLYDIAAEIISVLSSRLGDEYKVRPAGCITAGSAAMRFPDGFEICRINFKFSLDEQSKPLDFSLVLLCEHIMDAILNKNLSKKPADGSKNREHIVENLKSVKLSLETIVCSHNFCLDDLLALEPDDVIVFDKPLHEPIDVLIGQKKLFCGTIAKNDGNYAVVISRINK